MALKETKTVTVDSENEVKMRTTLETFGWELESKEGASNIKMTFRRDPERKNYAELKALEDQYNNAPLPNFTLLAARAVNARENPE